MGSSQEFSRVWEVLNPESALEVGRENKLASECTLTDTDCLLKMITFIRLKKSTKK